MKIVSPGMKACLSDGGTATVTDVLIDPNEGVERYIVLSANGYFGPDVVAPFAAVWRVDDLVHVTLSTPEMLALPLFDQATYCRDAGLCSRAAAHRGVSRHHHAGAGSP